MNERRQKVLTILFVIVNLVVWGYFVLPKVPGFIASLKPKTPLEAVLMDDPAASLAVNERVDFSRLRNPFRSVAKGFEAPRATPMPRTARPTPRPTEKPRTDVLNNGGGEVQRTFVSQFKLVSVILLRGGYTATLEEASHYGSSDVPYSYRFGQNSGGGSGSITVREGDLVQGEKVMKIRDTYVILEKNGLYYKLTFSGGTQVSGPDGQ